MIKSIVSKTLNHLGYVVQRKAVSPFSELEEIARYREQVVSLAGLDFKIADALSFRHSYKEIFEERIYEFATDNDAPLIIDCGSNYGTSVVFFKTRYPNAIITAVECDPEIYKLLEWNLNQRDYQGVSLMNRAISNSVEPVAFTREGADAGRVGKVIGREDSLMVETISLDSLIGQPIDFLKMDIEGEEANVICNSCELHNVTAMFIEYHSFVDQPQRLSALLEKLSQSGFRYYIKTQFCAARPLVEKEDYLEMDLQLNIFATRD